MNNLLSYSSFINENLLLEARALSEEIADPNKILAGQSVNLPKGETYVVKKGETLSLIAKKFGTTVSDLVKLNSDEKDKAQQAQKSGSESSKGEISDPNKILTGQTINLPKGETYVVKKGETLSQIAKKFGTTLPALISLNSNSPKPKSGKILISSKVSANFKPKIDSSKIDSAASNKLMQVQTTKCADFVNKFTDSVSYVGDAWMAKANENIGPFVYNIFDKLTKPEQDEAIKMWQEIHNRTSSLNLTGNKWKDSGPMSAKIKSFIQKLISKDPLNPSLLKLDDIVGIYFPPSSHHEEAFYEGGKNWFVDGKGKMGAGDIPGKTIRTGEAWGMNTHLGIVGAIKNGKPIIFHNIPASKTVGQVWADPIDKIHGGGKIVWARRPKSAGNPLPLEI
jgi:LysM repeat protein